MEALKKLATVKYARRNKVQEETPGAGEGGVHMGIAESTVKIVQDSEVCLTSSNTSVETAVEEDFGNPTRMSDLYEESLISGDSNNSGLKSSSFIAYRRSLSPDAILQGASSSSNSLQNAYHTSSIGSDYSSGLSFFGINSNAIGEQISSNVLVEYWWDLTPQNIHIIVTNCLYDTNSHGFNKCWTFLENKLRISRTKVFYTLAMLYFLYLMNGDSTRLLYYFMAVGYPMYRTFSTFKYRGVDACRSWLRYWVVFGWISMLDVVLYRYMKHWTLYWSAKTIITVYLLMPLVKGADLIYRDFIKKFNKTVECTVQFIVAT